MTDQWPITDADGLRIRWTDVDGVDHDEIVTGSWRRPPEAVSVSVVHSSTGAYRRKIAPWK